MPANTTLKDEIIIRPIEANDNSAMEQIIRSVLTEYGANKPGFAWQDPELSELSSVYQTLGTHYWVACTQNQVVGGCGIGKITPNDIPRLCELQKMYILPTYRGQGVGKRLLTTALAFAKQHYRWCYLETLGTMREAQQLYHKIGFSELPRPLINTEHGGCDRWYLIDMQPQTACRD